jgi:hypothetical protein
VAASNNLKLYQQQTPSRPESIPDPWQSIPQAAPRATGTPINVKGEPAWLPQLLAIRAANPGQLPTQWANLMEAQHGISTKGKRIRDVLERYDRQAAA